MYQRDSLTIALDKILNNLRTIKLQRINSRGLEIPTITIANSYPYLHRSKFLKLEARFNFSFSPSKCPEFPWTNLELLSTRNNQQSRLFPVSRPLNSPRPENEINLVEGLEGLAQPVLFVEAARNLLLPAGPITCRFFFGTSCFLNSKR